MSETPKSKSGWQIVRRILMGIAVLATLIAVFYTEEDWHGKRAWENCERDLEAKGVVLNWDKYIPPPVPDDQNFFKAPKMTEWFVRQKSGDTTSNELTSKLNAGFRPKQYQIAELTVLPVSTNAPDAENADMVLQYNPLGTVVFSPVSAMETNGSSTDSRIPLIQFADVPITDGISNLARQAGISVTLDPKIGYGQPDQNGQIKPEPRLSFRWTNITAKGVLVFILNKYDLQLIYDPTNNIARITTKDADTEKIQATPEVHDELRRLSAGVIGTNIISIYQNYVICARPPEDFKPMRIVVESDTVPDASEMRELFVESFPIGDANTKSGESLISIESDGSDTFRVMLDAVSAVDYLAWSDQFEPDFDLIREALKRPYAVIPGNYSKPYEQPIPNFVTMRTIAQTLAQRAQCFLLLDRPEEALHELTLMHDVCRILEKPPTGQPETLVEAMIHVAITGLYVATVREGFRLHAWQASQLSALQAQLAGINLPSWIAAAFQAEQAGTCHAAELVQPSQISKISIVSEKSSIWRKIRDLPHHAIDLAPRGWVYQNMAVCARMIQIQKENVLDTNQNVIPRHIELAAKEIAKTLDNNHSPFYLLARIAIPNFAKAMEVCTFNQTQANEAQIACALERYHLVHGEYPETFDALMPQFIEKIPHDIIGGEPLHYRREADGSFVLYSVGWNETDDGGQVVLAEGGSVDREKGDWVWQYPLK
jgi:hypothetical protein